MKRTSSILATLVLMNIISLLAGCGPDLEQQTDAQLGLNEQQTHGRRVFQRYCAVCHTAYSSRSSKGPALKGLYKKEYLPSGLLANDQFVEQSIVRGRKMMPATSLNQQQVEDLLAYLHTL